MWFLLYFGSVLFCFTRQNIPFFILLFLLFWFVSPTCRITHEVMVWKLDGGEASSSPVFIIVIILKSLWYRTKYLCTIAHHILGGIIPILWKNGYLVTLRYCEVSVTELMFVYLFIYFAQVLALFLGYAHALKLCFSNFFLILFVAFTFCRLLGSHILLCLSIHSYETCVLNVAAIW